MMKKLLIVGTNTIHTYNYIDLVSDYFDEILLLTDKVKEGTKVNAIEIDFQLKPQTLLKTPKKIKQIVAEFEPTVVHVHQANSVAFHTFLSGVTKKYPTVLTAWGSDILILPNKSWLLKKMVQFNLKKAHYFTSDSTFMAKEMNRLAGKELNVLIANFGINIDVKETPKENIIYSNRLHKPLYNVDKIINAFHTFWKENKEWKLVIAATGEETDKLKQHVSDLNLNDSVSFVGWVDKEVNSSWYSKAKIWVSIPDSDATSISLLEAMACGCIPVVSDLPASKEWVTDGENGVVVHDLNENFLKKITSISFDEAIIKNKARIEKDGLKSANRLKFVSLYTRILKTEKTK